MSPVEFTCSRRQFQLALCAGLWLAQAGRGWSARPAVSRGPTLLVQANNALALNLLRELDTDVKGSNHFLSPFSIESAVTIALEGARGQTAAEIGRAMRYPETLAAQGELPWDMQAVRTDFKNLVAKYAPADTPTAGKLREELTDLRKQLAEANAAVKTLTDSGKHREAASRSQAARKLADRINHLATQVDQYELHNANSLWVDESFPLASDYRQTIQEFYGSSGAFACDFRSKSDVERLRINRWVSEQTRDTINDILPPGVINSLTRLVIANAIYFKGTWSKPFDPQATKPAPFTMRGGAQTETAMMNAHGFAEGKYAAFHRDGSYFETPQKIADGFDEHQGYPGNDGFQVAELPYNGDAISMLILLPRRADGLDSLLESLTPEKIQACADRLEQRPFHVSMPKFKLESTYELNRPLQKLGMRQAFSGADANFRGLTTSADPEHELHISVVLHKAFVDVNEKGTEAAAATIIALETRAALLARPFVPSFTADRPFLFAIRDRQSGLILFIGKFEKPSAAS